MAWIKLIRIGKTAYFHIKPNTGHPNSHHKKQANKKLTETHTHTKKNEKPLSGPGISGLKFDQHQLFLRQKATTWDKSVYITSIICHTCPSLQTKKNMGLLRMDLELEEQL